MFTYYLNLALRSLKRNTVLTALMVLSIGIGVALAMTAWSLVRMMSHDPIPQKSAHLYVPTIDMWGPAARSEESGNGEPPDLLDYETAMALVRDHRARSQSPVYWMGATIAPSLPGRHPFSVSGFAVTGEFFPMLDVPFEYGSGWGAADDAHRAQVVVISHDLNGEVFGGGNSIGKTLTIDGHDYRVVGVMKYWNPQPLYYDVPAFGGFMLRSTDVFIPFNTAIAAALPHGGNTECWKSPGQPGFGGLLHSSCAWISYMVELDSAAHVAAYRRYLANFAHARFNWPPNVRLRDLMAWLDYEQVVPSGFKVLRLVAIGLLIVCLVDTVGLLLAKFLRRSGEIGVRRAMGATRAAICAQFLTEGAVVGLVGGLLGLLLTWLALLWVRAKMPPSWHMLTQVDSKLLGLSLAVAIVATLLASLYPAFRAAHVRPAWQLKSN